MGTSLRIQGDEIELYGVSSKDVTKRIKLKQFQMKSLELYSLAHFSHKDHEGYLMRINGQVLGPDVKVDIGGVQANLRAYQQSDGTHVFTDASFNRRPFDNPGAGNASPKQINISEEDAIVLPAAATLANVINYDVVYLYFDFVADKGVVISI